MRKYKKVFNLKARKFHFPKYKNFFMEKYKTFLSRHQPGPIKSVLLVIIGWLVGWLVGNAVFSETDLGIFQIFCMKLGDYKGRKVTEPDF